MFDVNFHIGIPAEIHMLLSAPADDYGTACDVGTLCAAALVKHLSGDPAMIGSNRVGAVIKRMKSLGGGRGYEAGFFSLLEHLMVEGAKHVDVDVLAVRGLARSAAARAGRKAESTHVLPNGSGAGRKRGRAGV